MRKRRCGRVVLYSAYMCTIITVTSLFANMTFNQILYIEKFTERNIPLPKETKPKWCSNFYTVDNDTMDPNTNLSLYTEDLFTAPPPPFESNYKNPCFYDACHYIGNREVEKLRCLPYFHVLGVDKCGSTDLFHRIVQHPQILENDGTLHKETMWWSWKRYGQSLKKVRNHYQSFDDYLRYFDGATGKIETVTYISTKQSVFSEHVHPVITGDGTPMDFWDFTGWPKIPQNKNLSEPVILTPHLIKQVNPRAKLILIFRHPTERLYSDYLFLGLGSSTPGSFHKKVVTSIQVFKNCERKHSLKWCLFSRKIHVSLPVRLYVGVYSVFLKEWLKVFPREQFLFLRNEDYSKDIKGTLSKVFRFLDVEELPEKRMNEIASSRREHITARKRKAGKLLNKTRKILDQFYAPFNRQLTGILNDFRYLWKEVH